MKKTFIGSSKLKHNFKMFRIKYTTTTQKDKIKQDVMQKMNSYLQQNDGRLINAKQLPNCQQIVFYFVTGQQGHDPKWQEYFRNDLFKGYNLCSGTMELGPTY